MNDNEKLDSGQPSDHFWDGIKRVYYPDKPPSLPGESDIEYSDRLIGHKGLRQVPYDHVRNRQCSIGYHEECSCRFDRPENSGCECPCHNDKGKWVIKSRMVALYTLVEVATNREIEESDDPRELVEFARVRSGVELHP